MTVEDLALQFVEFRGAMTNAIANLKADCKANHNEILLLRKQRVSNGWKNRTIFTGVGALVGGGVLETLHKILEHIN